MDIYLMTCFTVLQLYPSFVLRSCWQSTLKISPGPFLEAWSGHASKNPLHLSTQTSLSFDLSSNIWRPKLSPLNGLQINSSLGGQTLERRIKVLVMILRVLSPWWISPLPLSIWSCRIMERDIPYTRSRGNLKLCWKSCGMGKSFYQFVML